MYCKSTFCNKMILTVFCLFLFALFHVLQVNPNSKATRAYIGKGDVVETINGTPAYNLNNKDAINLVHGSDGDLQLVLCR